MLTEKIIRDAAPSDKPRFLWDEQVKGFGLKINPKGTKAFVLTYRTTAGHSRRITLGRPGELSLREARHRAGRELVTVREGGDPMARRKEQRTAPTVANALERFEKLAVERIALGRMAQRSLANYRNQIANYIRPALGETQAADVTRQDVEGMVSGLPPVQRNRVLALASRLFNLMEDWGWRPQHTNPCRAVERAREEPRDRVLAPSELTALSRALADVEERHLVPVAAIRFAALTGLRIGEVLAIRWADIDFESNRLTLPETKTGRRTHHLPSAALAVLDGLPLSAEWVFTTGRGSLTYKLTRTVFAAAAKRAGLTDVRLHDLRRTVMTCAAASGVNAHVLRDLLGHKTTAMADRYIRAVGNPVCEAREMVGSTMATLMNGQKAHG